MAQFDRRVTSASSLDPSLLPEAFTLFSIVVTYLRECKVLESIAERLRLQRKGGFQGVDLLVFFLALFTSGWGGKIRGFADRWAGPRGRLIAALAGRGRLASQSSVSRALDSVTLDVAQSFSALLLRRSEILQELLRHPAVQHQDCMGQRWHVFDMDPTATGVRLRALPEGDDLPDAIRKSEEIAKPGYLARKRGQAKVSRPTLMHRGARVYLEANLEAGNSDWSAAVQAGWDSVNDVAKCCELPIDRCVVVTDGESGGSVQSRYGIESEGHFVTRLAEYRPLDQPEVMDALQRARWERVEDGLSGPTRWATEFGHKTLGTGKARLIISRFENRSGSGRGAGKLVGDQQYEVYATDLPADAFPAPELVTLYYARGGIENYLAIEDDDFELDHIYSFNPAGQLLVTIIALFLHNLQIVLGMRARGGLPSVVLPAVPREVEAVGEQRWVVPRDLEALRSTIGEHDTAPNGETVVQIEVLRQIVQQRADLVLDGRRVLCLAKHELRFNRKYRLKDGTVVIRLRVRSGVCGGCRFRNSCTSSTKDAYRKELRVQLRYPAAGETFAIEHWTPPSQEVPPGPFQMRAPILAPQRLRREIVDVADQTRVRVITPLPARTCDETHGGLYVMTTAHRQHRRRTWAERLQWNRLPEGHVVTVEFIAGESLRRILPDIETPALREARH